MKADELSNLIDPIVRSFGCELWGVEYRNAKASANLRVFIDKEEGVSIDDCSNVSRQISAVMDVEDPIIFDILLDKTTSEDPNQQALVEILKGIMAS